MRLTSLQRRWVLGSTLVAGIVAAGLIADAHHGLPLLVLWQGPQLTSEHVENRYAGRIIQ